MARKKKSGKGNRELETVKKKAERHKLQEEMADLYIKGYSQRDLAEKFGILHMQVAKHLKEIRQRWIKNQIKSMNEWVSTELTKIDHLERTFWEAWERTIGDHETAITKIKKGVPHTEVKKSVLLGDPRYLAGIQWCIQKRCQLLGLDAAIKVRVDGGTEKDQPQFDFSGLTEEQRDAYRQALTIMTKQAADPKAGKPTQMLIEGAAKKAKGE